MFRLGFCCHHLEILCNFIFELIFCKWSPIGEWNVHSSRGNTWHVYVYHSLSLSFIVDILKAQNSGVFTVHVSSARLKVKEKGTVSLTGWAAEPTAFTGHRFVWTKLFPTMKESSGVLWNVHSYWTLTCLFLVVFSVSNCLRKCDS